MTLSSSEEFDIKEERECPVKEEVVTVYDSGKHESDKIQKGDSINEKETWIERGLKGVGENGKTIYNDMDSKESSNYGKTKKGKKNEDIRSISNNNNSKQRWEENQELRHFVEGANKGKTKKSKKKENQHVNDKTDNNYNPYVTNYSEISISTQDMNERYTTENEDNERLKGFRERYFSYFTPGGVRSSTFLFLFTAIGIGCVSVPYVFSKIGIILSLILILLNAIESYVTTELLYSSSLEHNIYVYGSLMKKVGNSFHKFIIDVGLFFSFISGYILILIFLSKILISCFEVLNFPAFCMDPIFLVTVICVLLIPLSSKNNIRSLRYVYLVSVLAITVTTITIIVQTRFYYKSLPEEKKKFLLFHIDKQTFKCFNILLFAFGQQQNACFIAGQFYRPTYKRLNKAASRSIILQICFYSFLGILEYLSFSDLIKDNFLLNYEKENVPMLVCKLLLSFSFFLSVPLNFMGAYQSIRNVLLGIKNIFYNIITYCLRRNTARETLLVNVPETYIDRLDTTSTNVTEEYENGQDVQQGSPNQKLCICILISILCATISVNVEHISNVISTCGGLACTLINCLLPALLYFKKKQRVKNKLQRYLTMTLLFFFSFMGLFSVFFTCYMVFAG